MSKSNRKSDYTPLVDQLRAMIEDSGLSTNAVAVAVGIPQPVLHRFIVGDRENVRLDTADKLCKFFGTKLTSPRWPKGQKEIRT